MQKNWGVQANVIIQRENGGINRPEALQQARGTKGQYAVSTPDLWEPGCDRQRSMAYNAELHP